LQVAQQVRRSDDALDLGTLTSAKCLDRAVQREQWALYHEAQGNKAAASVYRRSSEWFLMLAIEWSQIG
jgi:hypothetical protein